MKHSSTPEPAPKPTLHDVRLRFEAWRRSKKRDSRIPKSLWAAAAELCSEHRVSEVSRGLGLNYNELRRRVPGTMRSEDKPVVPGPEFVELSLGLGAQPVLWSVEFESAAGDKLKMTFSGTCGDFDPMELAKVFWGGRE